jgi:hypothetical protein
MLKAVNNILPLTAMIIVVVVIIIPALNGGRFFI